MQHPNAHPSTPRRRPRRSSTGWLGVGILIAGLGPAGFGLAGVASAQERVVLDTVVEHGRLVLELDVAEIQVFVDPGGEVILQATVDSTEEGAADVEALTLESDGADAVFRRPAAASGPTARLRVDVLVPPEVTLAVRGRDLLVRLESAVVSEAREEDGTSSGSARDNPGPDDTGPDTLDPEDSTTATDSEERPGSDDDGGGEPLAFEVDLTDSELIGRGIAGLGGRLRNSSADLAETQGVLRLESVGSFLEIGAHRGPIDLQAEGGEARLAETHGSHRIRGGNDAELAVDEGRGQLTAELQGGARLAIQGFRGDTALRGTGASFEGRRLWAATGQGLEVRGTDLDVVLEDCRGRAYEAHIDGGRFDGSGLVGRGQVTGINGANLELEDTNGRLALWLRSGATARVAEGRGRVEANVEDSELDLEDSQQLKLTAKDSTIRVRGLSLLTDFRAQSSELDIDLTTLRTTKPVLHLLTETRGEIRLAAPCLVQVKSEDPLGASNVSVSGCELKRHGEGKRGRAPTRTDGSRMIQLTLDIALDAEVEVVGY